MWSPSCSAHEAPWRDHILYEYYWERNFPATPTTLALRTDRWKCIYYHGVWDKDGFYDLQTDPLERHNLINVPSYREQIGKFQQQLFDELGKSAVCNFPSCHQAAKCSTIENCRAEDAARGLPGARLSKKRVGLGENPNVCIDSVAMI